MAKGNTFIALHQKVFRYRLRAVVYLYNLQAVHVRWIFYTLKLEVGNKVFFGYFLHRPCQNILIKMKHAG